MSRLIIRWPGVSTWARAKRAARRKVRRWQKTGFHNTKNFKKESRRGAGAEVGAEVGADEGVAAGAGVGFVMAV